MPPDTTCSPTSKDTTIVSGSIPLSGISPPNRQSAKPLNPVSTKSGEGQTFGSREENETIKEGETPEDWKSKLAKNRQKDKDARWTKKYERSYFGYKNHIGVDRRHKFVRRYVVSDASVHDSQKFEDVLDTSNTASDVWADSAYRSQEIEENLGRRGLKNRIHRRPYRNRKLSEAQKAANTTRSKVRARVEHVFGDQKNAMGAEIVRTIGIVRARCKIGMTNLVYNMRRFIILERMAEVAR